MRAKELRQHQTDAESLLWYRLRDRRFMGLKFRRQRPIGDYIADFVCLDIMLVIELDGGQHAEQEQYDDRRAAAMARLGFKTVRFWNHEVLNETDGVMQKIMEVAESRAATLTPTLSRKRERE